MLHRNLEYLCILQNSYSALCSLLIIRKLDLEVATKWLFHQQVKYCRSYNVVFAHGNVFPELFLVVWIFLRFLGVICFDRWVLNEGHKNYFKDCCLMNSQSTFLFLRVVSTTFSLVCFLCLKDNTFDKRKNVFLFHFGSSHSISTPFCWEATFNPKF